MQLTFLVITCIAISVIIKLALYFFMAEDFDEDNPASSTFNSILLMVITSIIPFALGCAVGIYAI